MIAFVNYKLNGMPLLTLLRVDSKGLLSLHLHSSPTGCRSLTSRFPGIDCGFRGHRPRRNRASLKKSPGMVSEGKSLHVRRSKERRNEYKQEREQAFNLIHKVVSL